MLGSIKGAAPIGLVRQAYNWWWRELAAVLPKSMRIEPRLERRILVRAGDPLIVRSIDTEGCTDVQFPSLDRLDAESAEQLRAYTGDAETAISLDAHQVHRLQLSLPYEARSQLYRAVGYQLSTVAPINPERLLYSVRLTERPARGHPLQVEVMLARKDDVARLAALWRTAIGPAAIGWAEATSHHLSIVFDTPTSPPRRRRSAVPYLAGLLLGLLICAPSALALVLGIVEDNLRRETALAHQNLTPRLQAATDAKRLERIERVLAQPLNQPRVTALIDALAQSLPPTAWVESIDWSSQQARIKLIGADRAAIDRLRADPLLARLKVTTPSGVKSHVTIDIPLTKA